MRIARYRWSILLSAGMGILGPGFLPVTLALTVQEDQKKFEESVKMEQPTTTRAMEGQRRRAAPHDPATTADGKDLARTLPVPARRSGDKQQAGADHVAGAPASEPQSRSYYVEPRSVGTRRELNPPSYARTLAKTEWPALKELDWLDFGLDYRMRYEYRDGDLRRPVGGLDEPILTRTRVYLGVHDLADPFRFHAEFEDARRYNSKFPEDNRDINRHELIQAVAELYFADRLGPDRPLRLQYGRMTMEYLDRRLIALNQWRNTTNNFQGFRALLGQDSNDWQIDFLALQPIERLIDRFDEVEARDPWFYGAIASWRRWSEIITLQPYYLGLRREKDGVRRRIETVGLRGYGIVGDSGFDYDFDYVYQFGRVGSGDHSAFMLTTELGYTFDRVWRPRLSGFIGVASGDRNPDDASNQRFDRLFGFARPWSANDYFAPENLIAPKLRLDFQPHAAVRVDMGYSTYWLQSATDAWVGGNNLRDRTGRSGDFIGHELDIRARFKWPYVDTTLGYAFFNPGEFVRKTGRPADTNFFYIEIAPRLLF